MMLTGTMFTPTIRIDDGDGSAGESLFVLMVGICALFVGVGGVAFGWR